MHNLCNVVAPSLMLGGEGTIIFICITSWLMSRYAYWVTVACYKADAPLLIQKISIWNFIPIKRNKYILHATLFSQLNATKSVSVVCVRFPVSKIVTNWNWIRDLTLLMALTRVPLRLFEHSLRCFGTPVVTFFPAHFGENISPRSFKVRSPG